MKRRYSLVQEKICLEKIVGCTAAHNVAVSVCPSGGESRVAYAAGGVAVIRDFDGQEVLLASESPKPISCLSFSSDGQYLAVGEYGHQPAVLVWDLSTNKSTPLKGHENGVGCVGWAPNSKWVISVGYQSDQHIQVWDWRNRQIVACAKVANKIHSIAFTEDCHHFVTCGTKHLKSWNFSDGQTIKKTEKTFKGRAVLDGKMFPIENFKEITFLDVCIISKLQLCYAIASTGLLLCGDLKSKKNDKFFNMNMKCYAISTNTEIISVATEGGTIRLFDKSLNPLATIPSPSNYLNQCIPIDAVGCRLLKEKLFSLYSNHSCVLWDIKDTKSPVVASYLPSHSSSVWDLCPLQSPTFATTSADYVLNFWNISLSNPLMGSISLQDPTSLAAPKGLEGEQPTRSSGGLKSVAVTPDFSSLATGDSNGMIRVFDISTETKEPPGKAHPNAQPTFATIYRYDSKSAFPMEVVKGHSMEISKLEFTSYQEDTFLISASRDRLINVYERTLPTKYILKCSLDDHKTAVVDLCTYSAVDEETDIISCGGDKTIHFRKMHKDEKNNLHFTRYHSEMVNGATKLQIEPEGRQMVVVGADKKIPLWDLNTARKFRTVLPQEKGNEQKNGKDVGVAFDPSGQYLVTSSQDHILRVYDVEQGTLLGKLSGHSEFITSVKFLNDYSHLLSTDVSGCIFVWKLSPEMTFSIIQKMVPLPVPSPYQTSPSPKDPIVKEQSLSPIIKPELLESSPEVQRAPKEGQETVKEEQNLLIGGEKQSLSLDFTTPPKSIIDFIDPSGVNINMSFIDTDSLQKAIKEATDNHFVPQPPSHSSPSQQPNNPEEDTKTDNFIIGRPSLFSPIHSYLQAPPQPNPDNNETESSIPDPKEPKNLGRILENLRFVFDESVSFYKNFASQAAFAESEETRQQFEGLFEHMYSELAQILQQDPTEHYIERYSDRLLEVFEAKLNAKTEPQFTSPFSSTPPTTPGFTPAPTPLSSAHLPSSTPIPTYTPNHLYHTDPVRWNPDTSPSPPYQ